MHRVDNSLTLRPIVRLKSLTDGPTSGSWSKLLSLGTTRILRALTGSISGIFTARSMNFEYTLSISMFCLFYAEREETFILREYNLYQVCAGVYSVGHKVSCRNLDLSQLFVLTYVYAASIRLIAASHLYRIKIHLPVHPLLFYCSSNDPALLPQTAVHSISSKMCVCVLHGINDGWTQLLCSSKRTGVQVLQTKSIFSCATPLGTSRRGTLHNICPVAYIKKDAAVQVTTKNTMGDITSNERLEASFPSNIRYICILLAEYIRTAVYMIYFPGRCIIDL